MRKVTYVSAPFLLEVRGFYFVLLHIFLGIRSSSKTPKTGKSREDQHEEEEQEEEGGEDLGAVHGVSAPHLFILPQQTMYPPIYHFFIPPPQLAACEILNRVLELSCRLLELSESLEGWV
jgi:hypothetical protein